MQYFAYGSNLHPQRLRLRIDTSRLLGPARLPCYALRFHNRSTRDGSAKCDAYFTADPADCLLGVIYEISVSQKQLLDGFESLHRGYNEARVQVLSGDETRDVFTYVADPGNIDPAAQPFDWYKEHVLQGARYHGFPTPYIRRIEAIEAASDPDTERVEAERAVYYAMAAIT